MVAYNFRAEFAPLVETLDKRTTIRLVGKRGHARQGDRLQLYSGQRTKNCRKLLDPDPICALSLMVTVRADHLDGSFPLEVVNVHGELVTALSRYKQEAVARLDGFASPQGLHEFFAGNYSKPMRLLRWVHGFVPAAVLRRLVACFDTWETGDWEPYESTPAEERKFEQRWCNNCKHRSDSGCPVFEACDNRDALSELWVYLASCPCCLGFEDHG